LDFSLQKGALGSTGIALAYLCEAGTPAPWAEMQILLLVVSAQEACEWFPSACKADVADDIAEF